MPLSQNDKFSGAGNHTPNEKRKGVIPHPLERFVVTQEVNLA